MKLKRSTCEVLLTLSMSLADQTHRCDLFGKTDFNDVKYQYFFRLLLLIFFSFVFNLFPFFKMNPHFFKIKDNIIGFLEYKISYIAIMVIFVSCQNKYLF